MTKTKKTRIRLAVWGRFDEKGEIEFSPFNQTRINIFSADKKKKDIRVEFSTAEKAKSEEFLGWFWGGLLPAYVAHNKFSLRQETLDLDPLLLSRLCRKKKITRKETREAERMFLREFAPVYVKDIKTGRPEREGARLSAMGSKTAVMFSVLVYDYMINNGYPIPNTEEYKKIREEADLLIEKGRRHFREEIF